MNILTKVLHPKKLVIVLACLAQSGLVYAAGTITIDDAWVAAHGPIVQGTYQGTASQAAITVNTKKSITIQNSTVSGPGNLINISSGASVSILNTTGTGTNPNINGQQKGAFVNATSPANLLVKNCTIASVRFGVYSIGFSGSGTQSVKILQNIINNIDSRPSDGHGGYIMTNVNQRAHAIQFNAIRGISNAEIAWNQIIITPFQGAMNDTINMYSSSGLQSNHLRIHDNFISGPQFPSPGASGPNYSGGGIITDGKNTDSASTATAYVDVYNNQIVMTANYGIAAAAGHDNNFYNNRVISAGKLASGAIYASPNAQAAYNWDAQHQPTSTFYNNHIHDNVLGLLAKNGSSLTRHDWWFPTQSSTENNVHFTPVNNASPTIQDEKNEFTSWQQKLTTNNIVIGVQ